MPLIWRRLCRLHMPCELVVRGERVGEMVTLNCVSISTQTLICICISFFVCPHIVAHTYIFCLIGSWTHSTINETGHHRYEQPMIDVECTCEKERECLRNFNFAVQKHVCELRVQKPYNKKQFFFLIFISQFLFVFEWNSLFQCECHFFPLFRNWNFDFGMCRFRWRACDAQISLHGMAREKTTSTHMAIHKIDSFDADLINFLFLCCNFHWTPFHCSRV